MKGGRVSLHAQQPGSYQLVFISFTSCFSREKAICGCIREGALTWLITKSESSRSTRPSAIIFACLSKQAGGGNGCKWPSLISLVSFIRI